MNYKWPAQRHRGMARQTKKLPGYFWTAQTKLMFMQPSLVTHDSNKTGRSSDLGIFTQLCLPGFPVAYQNCAPPLQRRDREA